MAFDYSKGKVNEDGSLTDGTNTIAVGSNGYHLAKARILAGGNFARKQKNEADYKADISKRQKGSYKRLKAVLGAKGLNIDKSGYNALMEDLENGTLLDKYTDVMTRYRKKTLSQNIVDVANGKETKFTKKVLAKEQSRVARETERAERKAAKEAEKLQKAEARIAAQKMKEEQRKAEKLAKIQMAEAKLAAQKKELMK